MLHALLFGDLVVGFGTLFVVVCVGFVIVLLVLLLYCCWFDGCGFPVVYGFGSCVMLFVI